MNNHLQVWVELLFSTSPSMETFGQFFGLLFLISVLIAGIAANTAIQHLGNKKISFFIFLLLVQVFIPLLGSILAICSIFLLKNYHRQLYPVVITSMQPHVYSRKNPVKIMTYGEGWATLRLELKQFSEQERKQALISLSRGSKAKVNAMYNQLVSDDMEELRISAFSLLEKQQNYIHEKINELLKIYKNDNTDEIEAFFSKQIALLYHELVYLKLGDKELKKIIIEKSEKYANLARTVFPKDPSLLIVLARNKLAAGDVTESIELLKRAAKLNAPSTKVYPYLAEESFKQRDYANVKTYLSADSSFVMNLMLRPIVKFWCPND